MYSARRGHGGLMPLKSLEQMVRESDLGHYTVEQVISKADPQDYKEELARLTRLFRFENGVAENLKKGDKASSESPNKRMKKLADLTLGQFVVLA